MFGGNSNWRGPVWFSINMLLVRALLKLYAFYGDTLTVECPTPSSRSSRPTASRRNRGLRTPLQSPPDLVAAAGRCRAVLTGSYHAAVFALAQGVPAVCLVNSPYYAGKFDGLAALFPSACSIVSLQDASLPATLDRTLAAAWHTSPRAQELARRSARAQLQAGRDAYKCFAATEGKRVSRRWRDKTATQAPGPGGPAVGARHP